MLTAAVFQGNLKFVGPMGFVVTFDRLITKAQQAARHLDFEQERIWLWKCCYCCSKGV
jgi:hypothetical protein